MPVRSTRPGPPPRGILGEEHRQAHDFPAARPPGAPEHHDGRQAAEARTVSTVRRSSVRPSNRSSCFGAPHPGRGAGREDHRTKWKGMLSPKANTQNAVMAGDRRKLA